MSKSKQVKPMSFRQKILVAVTDVAILGELCYAMYCANLNPDEFTPVFMKTFFSFVIPTILSALVLGFMLKAKPEQVELEENQAGS